MDLQIYVLIILGPHPGTTGSTRNIWLDRPEAIVDADAYQGAGISL